MLFIYGPGGVMVDVKPSLPQEGVWEADGEGKDSLATGKIMSWAKVSTVSASVSLSASVRMEGIPPSHHPEKYDVLVERFPSSEGIPEGMAKVLDMLQQSIKPAKTDVGENEEKTEKK